MNKKLILNFISLILLAGAVYSVILASDLTKQKEDIEKKWKDLWGKEVKVEEINNALFIISLKDYKSKIEINTSLIKNVTFKDKKERDIFLIKNG